MADVLPTCRWLRITALALLLCMTCSGSYIITTPRKWTSGETVQVCAFVVDTELVEGNQFVIAVKTKDEAEYLLPRRTVQVPSNVTELCDEVFVSSEGHTEGQLEITGRMGGSQFHHKKTILFANSITKTFIQTDKFLYMPNQEVQFRMLTVTGPFLKVSHEKYPLIWVETPSGSRIGQWSDVDNSAGLIHLSMKLSNEPEEGIYKIKVRPPNGAATITRTFKVEDYVLPRFEVTIKPPNYILGSDTKFTITVCAKYTFGQPVKGNVSLELNNGGWGSSKVEHVMENRISGCKDFEVLADDVAMNGVHYIGHSITIKAKVIEDGTNQKMSQFTSVEIQRTALNFKSIGREEFLKPNLPFTGKVKAAFPDETPAAGEVMEVCAEGACKNITSDSNGVIEFVVPSYTATRIQVNAARFPKIRHDSSSYRYIMQASMYSQRLKQYFSPSKSSLIIHGPERRLPCHPDSHLHVIPVLYAAVNQTKARFTVQVISRGQIQSSSTEEYELPSTDLPFDADHLLQPLPLLPQFTVTGVINVPVRIPPTASPIAKIVIWYSRDDGEVVSDTQEIKVKKCLTNEVNLAWSESRTEPGDAVNISLSAEEGSLCSLGVVDKSVELLSSQNDDLTVDKIFEIVKKTMVKESENAQSDDYKYCRTGRPQGRAPLPGPVAIPFRPEFPSIVFPRQKRSIWRPYTPSHVDALKIFDNSGLFFFTDLTVETRPCDFAALRRHPPISAQSSRMEEPQRWRMNNPRRMKTRKNYKRLDTRTHVHTSKSNAVSVSEETDVKQNNQQRSYFPETWLWNLVHITASGVRTEKLTLPDTITEWVGKAVCVHSEKGVGVSTRTSVTTFTSFFVDLTLPPSVKRGEILPVKISVFNYLHEALPVKVVLEESSEYEILGDPDSEHTLGHQSSCIQPEDKVVHTIKIRPIVLGDVNITIRAFVDELFPEVCGQEYVISKRDLLIKPVKVEAEGFLREKTWTKYICSRDIEEGEDYLEEWNIDIPSDIVEDTARSWVTAVGDLLGPTLENLGSLVRMPYGCGEQNMLNFAPNIYILQYLGASNQSTPAIAGKAIDYMKQGYQRELTYRHDDGSYSAFGNSDASGSTWLTAFVLKSFAQARQFIQMDVDDISMSRDWIKSTQMENGCFESVGKVFHKGMKGGMGNGDSPVPLTAYVLISLLEAGEPVTSKTVSEAAFCLVAVNTTDIYTLVLKAYALALCRVHEAPQIMQQVINQAVETTSTMHWELPAGAGKSDAVAVETAGYAILAMMTLNATLYDNQARKVVKWISSQRNGQGGFISTQDTVVALQALAAYEIHQSQETVNLAITVESDGLEHDFRIDDSNKLLLQMVNLPVTPTNVIVGMVGEGCALVQAVLRYNVPSVVPTEAFLLNVETETAPDEKCITKKINVCASYQIPGEKSNMAVIEVNLVSGFIPEKADLKQIVGYGTGLIKRYEVDGLMITFYIDEFSAEDICLTFRIIREIEVDDVKPGTVKVYDYYQPEYSVSKTYVLPPNTECNFGSIIREDEIIVEAGSSGIIIDYIVLEDEPSTSTVDPIAGLVDALESI